MGELEKPASPIAVVLDLHHIILYGLLALGSAGGLSVVHQWRMDLQKAELTKKAQDQVIAAADKRTAEREQVYQEAVKELNALKSTPQTTTKQIVERLPQLIQFPEKVAVEPEHSPVTGQIVPGKEDLVLSLANQKALNDKLVECASCEADRQRLTGDLADQKVKTTAVEKERDAFKEAAKGGSLKQRMWRRTKAFLVDAVVVEGLRCAARACP